MDDWIKHIIKYEYEEGEKLKTPALWCGADARRSNWHFNDAQHAALTVENGGRLVPCKACCDAVKENLEGA